MIKRNIRDGKRKHICWGVFWLLSLYAPPSHAAETPPFAEQVYTSLTSECWGCTVVGYGYDLMVHYARGGSAALAEAMRPFLAVMCCLWLLVPIGRLVLPFGAPPLVTGMLLGKRAMIMVVVFSLLGYPRFVWDFLTEPLLTASFAISHLLQEDIKPTLTLEAGAAAVSAFDTLLTDFHVKGLVDLVQNISAMMEGNCGAATRYLSVFDTDMHKEENRGRLLCQIDAMQRAFAAPLALGYSHMTQHAPATLASFQWHSGGMAGMAIFGLYATVLMVFPLVVMESLFKMALLGMLLPLILAALLFPSWQRYSVSALKILFQSLLTLVLLNAVAVIGAALLRTLSGSWGGKDPLQLLLTMTEHLAEPGLTGQLTEGLTLTSSFFWSLFLVGSMVAGMLKRSSSWSAQLIGAIDGRATEEVMQKAEILLPHRNAGSLPLREPVSNSSKRFFYPEHT